MTAYRQAGKTAKCGACRTILDREVAYFNTRGEVVCRYCMARGTVTDANQIVERWRAAQSPAATAAAIVVTILVFAVGYLGRC